MVMEAEELEAWSRHVTLNGHPMTVYDPELIDLRKGPDGQFSIYAKKDIIRSQCVLEEKALSVFEGPTSELWVYGIILKLKQAEEDESVEMIGAMELLHPRGKRPLLETEGIPIVKGRNLISDWVEKINANCFECDTNGERRKNDQYPRRFLFRTISTINHSCYPNVITLTHHDPARVIARRDIKAGEQLYNSYEYTLFDDTKARTSLLMEKYAFDCACPCCIPQTPGGPRPPFPTHMATEEASFLESKTRVQSLLPFQLACYMCGDRSKRLQRCTRCLVAVYCQKKCQIEHWKMSHRKVCVLFKD